jgi:aspartate/methionine/tyrosine aminotransferase
MDAPAASRPAVNPLVADTGTPPIPEAQGWVQRYGGAHGPLINMSQAVPGYPPHPDFMARLVETAASVDATRYGPIAGDADLRAAYAGHLAALSGGDIEAADVAITAGCNMRRQLSCAESAVDGGAPALPPRRAPA